MNSTITKAFDAWCGNYISISNKELEWDELHSNLPDPEKILIMKDEFSHLSNEAKEVVGLIYNAPYTILQLMKTQKRENLTIGSIEVFLIENGWSKKRVAKVFRELKSFVKNL